MNDRVLTLVRILLALAASAAVDISTTSPSLAASDSGLQPVTSKAGGTILEGRIDNAGSSDGAFRASLAEVRERFADTLRVLGAVRSTDQTLTLALFKASAGATSVGGYILTTFVPRGTSRVDVIFDRVDRVGRTLAPMLAQVSASHGNNGSEAGAASVAASLHDVVSPDGSVHAQLPAGWRTPVFAQGQFAAIGPDQAEVDQEISVPLSDPTGELRNTPWTRVAYTPDVARDYVAVTSALAARGVIRPQQISISHVAPGGSPFAGASVAELTGTSVRDGTTYRFDGFILVTAPNQFGGWSLSVKMVVAPATNYERDLPTLLAVYNSYNVDQRVRGRQVAATLEADREGMARGQAMMAATRARDTAVFDASMGHARDVQSGIDRSTSGFVHYLSDTTVLENTSSGGRTSADAGFAANVVNADPNNFRIVPVSEYRAGD